MVCVRHGFRLAVALTVGPDVSRVLVGRLVDVLGFVGIPIRQPEDVLTGAVAFDTPVLVLFAQPDDAWLRPVGRLAARPGSRILGVALGAGPACEATGALRQAWADAGLRAGDLAARDRAPSPARILRHLVERFAPPERLPCAGPPVGRHAAAIALRDGHVLRVRGDIAPDLLARLAMALDA